MAPSAPFTPGWHFKEGKLIRFSKRHVEVLRAWPEPMAWRKTRASGWKHVRPRLRLGEIQGAASGEDLRALRSGEWLPHAVEAEEAGHARGQMLFPFLTPARVRIEAGLRTRMEAARGFLATIPRPIRRLVGPFEDRQWHVLALLARCPGADDLVKANPALAWAIASNWVFHQPAVKQPIRAARRLVRVRRREAAAWLGFPGTASAARQLAKVPREAIRVGLLLDLRRALHDADGSALLRHLPTHRRGAVTLAASDALRRHVTAGLLNEIAAHPRWRDNLRAFGTLRDGLAMAEHLEHPMPSPFRSLARLLAFHDELVEETNLGRDAAIFGLEFPPPPFPGTETIEPLTRPGDLLTEGREMSHCAVTYAQDVAAGRTYLYRVVAPERATLEVAPRQRGWAVTQVRGRHNSTVQPSTLLAVRSWFEGVTRRAGVRGQWLRHERLPAPANVPEEVPF